MFSFPVFVPMSKSSTFSSDQYVCGNKSRLLHLIPMRSLSIYLQEVRYLEMGTKGIQLYGGKIFGQILTVCIVCKSLTGFHFKCRVKKQRSPFGGGEGVTGLDLVNDCGE